LAGRQKQQESRNQKKVASDRSAREYFQFRLACVDTLDEARKLAGQGPSQSEHARPYYANLALLLGSEFTQLPPSAGRVELQLYLDLVGRLATSGQITAKARESIVAAIQAKAKSTTLAVAGKMSDRLAAK
jgi:hypothetical protein